VGWGGRGGPRLRYPILQKPHVIPNEAQWNEESLALETDFS
jgi:hypothetical protein